MKFPRIFSPNLRSEIIEITKKQWHMGISSFGGPVVQFSNFNRIFVDKYEWLSDATYQELFALAQALPGSASTKLLFIITLLHTSMIPALISFLYWAIPGALGMFFLAVGVGQIGDTLPIPVYALLSGLNAAICGVILLAAINLSNKAITDKLSFALIFLGGAAGICYTSLWYFPVLMAGGGITAVIFDSRHIQRWWAKGSVSIKGRMHLRRKGKQADPNGAAEEMELQDLPEQFQEDESVWLPNSYRDAQSESAKVNPGRVDENLNASRRVVTSSRSVDTTDAASIPTIRMDMDPEAGIDASDVRAAPPSVVSDGPKEEYPVWLGVGVVIGFLASFVAVIVVRALVKGLPVSFSLFSNLYLAGTIIFGGGPVVIPLLREYIVSEGWVSSRDFIIGLALIQAFPGPNFNFAVYLGALTYHNYGYSIVGGAIVSFVAMYAPGMLVAGGMFTFWNKLRRFRAVLSILRGVNAAAIGLVWTAIYRIWESGYLNVENTNGTSLGNDPWWVVVAATAFVGGRGWGVPAPIAIFIGGLMGIVWWAVTTGGQV
ncbi:chromate transporter-domain-containing protein [Lipomyces oligophaga]|uniref:chromate transporter-domain-containing protein n=1 Tax=Lipomyces oligophaga TaxID=45792 RepID=UPI0034CD7C87